MKSLVIDAVPHDQDAPGKIKVKVHVAQRDGETRAGKCRGEA
jgi:hypothetical protein